MESDLKDDLIWLGAVLDCEGSITFFHSGHNHKRIYPGVYISNYNDDLIDRVLAIAGCGHTHKYGKNHQWSLHGIRAVETFLKRIRPFLSVKALHADCVLEFCRLNRNNRAYCKKYSREALKLVRTVFENNKRKRIPEWLAALEKEVC